MQAGLSNQVCTFENMASTVEATLPKPGKRGAYKKLTA